MATNFHFWKHFMVCMSGQPGFLNIFEFAKRSNFSKEAYLRNCRILKMLLPPATVVSQAYKLIRTAERWEMIARKGIRDKVGI